MLVRRLYLVHEHVHHMSSRMVILHTHVRLGLYIRLMVCGLTCVLRLHCVTLHVHHVIYQYAGLATPETVTRVVQHYDAMKREFDVLVKGNTFNNQSTSGTKLGKMCNSQRLSVR